MPKIGKGISPNKPSWNAGQTTTIRIPIELKEEIIAIARAIDDIGIDKTIIIDLDSLNDALKLLDAALKLPANKGGAIKEQIKTVIALLKYD